MRAIEHPAKEGLQRFPEPAILRRIFPENCDILKKADGRGLCLLAGLAAAVEISGREAERVAG